MSDTEVSIHEFIKKEIEPAANALIKEQKEGVAKLAKIMIDLGKAIDKPDMRMVKLLSKALDAESPLIANRLSRTGKLLERLEEAESETDLDTDLKEIEDITTKLSELENKLKHNYTTIKEYQDKANDALNEISDAEGDAAQAWAVHEAWLRKQLEAAKKRLQDIQKISEQAKKAAANRDEKALKEAVDSGAELRDAKPTAKEVEDMFSSFCEDVHPEKLTQDLQDQFKRDRDKFQKVVDEITNLSGQVEKIQEQIEKMDTAPVDPKKVSATLKIPSQYDGKVKKAVDLDKVAAGKALEAILKEIKTPMSAKDIVSKLEKANLV
jgi:DNA repair exonuclease SbcCD ATPase subunit